MEQEIAEKWAQIPAEPDYEVSDQGRIRYIGGLAVRHGGNRKKPGTLKHQGLNSNGYKRIKVIHGRITKNYLVHRLVAEAFLPPPMPQQTQINHKDGDKTNNCADNLEWCTCKENAQHYQRMKRASNAP